MPPECVPAQQVRCEHRLTSIEVRLTGIEGGINDIKHQRGLWGGRVWGMFKGVVLLFAGWCLAHWKNS